jgi:peptidoglycan/LPS O-acetylase OafA/YrhL
VGIVALNHAGVPHVGGGYVGVDAFFVVSGFLITGWLMRRTEREGRVPFVDFYAARARRILPAASLTLVVTAVLSWYYLNFVRALSVLHDCIWAAFFAANIHFAQISTDYFAQDTPPSPVQHYWTLAVEEQFYLAWPVMLAIALYVLRGRSRKGARPVGAVVPGLILFVGVAVAASLAWSVRYTAVNQPAAYFSTLARAWELGAGVLLALLAGRLQRLPYPIRLAAGWAGLAALLVAATTYSAQTPFPGSAAALPVGGAVLVIFAGLGEGRSRLAVGNLLGRQPFRLTGDISYSIYLWHWPLLIIPMEYADHPLGLRENLALLAVAYGISLVTYTLVENPIRHADAFRPPGRALALWPITVAAVVVAAGAAIAQINQHLADAAARARPAPALTTRTSARVLAYSVTSARARTPVPVFDLTPTLQDLVGDVYRVGSCISPFGSDTGHICRWGDVHARRTMVVFGDSHAQMWMAGFLYFAERHHWQLIPLVKEGCEPDTLQSSDPQLAQCRAWLQWATEEIRAIHPGAVVVSMAYTAPSFNQASTSSGLSMVLHALTHEVGHVLLLQDVPHISRNPTDCLLAHGATFGSCTYPLTRTQSSIFATMQHVAASAGVGYLPTLQWFCTRALCPTVVGNVIAYRDLGHVTNSYATSLRQPLAGEIAALVK